MAKGPSAAVLAARGRRGGALLRTQARLEFYIDNVLKRVNVPLGTRVKLATEVLRRTVVQNISRPVTKTPVKGKDGTSRTRITDRSLPGEFPKADTTLLMKTIFGETRQEGEGVFDGYVGTPVDYGLRLELHMDRSFLLRTFNETLPTIRRIIVGSPIK